MIILKKLNWSNCFSYGENNSIDFSKSKVTQIIGENGNGKSSIVLVLQEILFSKNSKGIKKANISNRYSDRDGYDITLEFEVDGVEYLIDFERKGAKVNVTLLKDGEDISSHTAPATYKTIEEIIGLDFTTFCQLVYQSSTDSLAFLNATDTTRKKFLISLLGLNEYTDYEQKTKKIFSQVSSEYDKVNAKVEQIQTWFNKNKLTSTEVQGLYEIPNDPENLRNEISSTEHELKNLESINSKISVNNLSIAKHAALLMKLEQYAEYSEEKDTRDLISRLSKATAIRDSAQKMIDKVSTLKGNCPTCLSDIDAVRVESIRSENSAIVEKANSKVKEIKAEIDACNEHNKKHKEYKSTVVSLETLSIDRECSTELLDAKELRKRLESLRNDLAIELAIIEDLRKKNTIIQADNVRLLQLQAMHRDYAEELEEKSLLAEELENRVSSLAVLKRAFSTKGLVAFKIESMVKDLETLINEYLAEFSDGRFTIEFKVDGDKLNVMVTDEGKEIEITALSSGELARVNTSTLLAIRKLLNTLSSNKLNLLFLDEVLNVLDETGKQRLVEILNEEEDLNSFIVSHGWQHPLLSRLRVEKDNKISRIEED